jgi:hypothetical protein
LRKFDFGKRGAHALNTGNGVALGGNPLLVLALAAGDRLLALAVQSGFVRAGYH